MKKVLSTILSLVLVLSMMPMVVFAGDAEAVLYTDTEATTVSAGDTFEYTISISGSYIGYSIAVAKDIDGLEVTKVTGERGVSVDDKGEYWLLSVAPWEVEDDPKTPVATVKVTVGDDAQGTIELGFVNSETMVNDWSGRIAYDEEFASVTVESASVEEPEVAAVLYTDTEVTDVAIGDTFEYTISISGSYIGYSIAVAKDIDGLEVTKVTGERGVSVDDKGEYWLLSVAPWEVEDDPKTPVATVKVTVGANAQGTIVLGFVNSETMVNDWSGRIAYDEEFASVTVESAPVVVPVTGVTLDKTEATVTEGDVVTLTATVAPEDATDKTVTWETSDAAVATVSNGVVTAVKAGTATITAKAGDKSATCVITVEAKVIPVTGVTLDKTTATVTEGETVTLTATVAPEDATDKTVTWKSSDEAVATVAGGVVTTKKAGTATITATAGDKSATCVITVEAKVVAVTGVALNKTEATLTVGDILALTATVTPDNATDKTVTWTTSDETVASVSNGVVTAIKAGTATITATAGDKSAACVVTVEEAAEEEVLTFKVSDARAVAGKQVKVNVSVENNPGIAGMVLKFDYNTEAMTLVDYETGDDFGATTNFDDPNRNDPSLFFAWVKDSNYEAEGTILTLIFEVSETAELGDYVVEVSCPDDVVTNEELEVLGYNTVSGKVTVVDVEPGDAYSDGIIDVKDAIAIAQYLAQWTEIENFDIVAADCYADGTVDVKDAVLLAQFLADWDVELGMQP